MKTLQWMFVTLIFVSLSAVGDCVFDGNTPGEFDKLKPDDLISVGGTDCEAFELWVGPNDENFAQYKIKIPRAMGSHTWQQCGYSIGMSEFKFKEYLMDFIGDDGDELVRFQGVCGEVRLADPDSPDTAYFVPSISTEVVLRINED